MSANWQSIVETSTKIQASYIMERKLTEAQVNELKQALPEHFKQLDAEFHQRAVRLGAAASAHDAELVSFEYSRLIGPARPVMRHMPIFDFRILAHQ